MKRDLLSLEELTQTQITDLFDLARKLKRDRSYLNDHLKGKSVGLVFQKPSNRTRVSFEVGVSQLGGNCLYLGPEEINLGVRESTADVARTLSRYLDGIVARTYTHQDIIDLAESASVPIINGLSDLHHPCQALADIFSIEEKLGKAQGVVLAYVGDGNNVCHSLMMGCAKAGIHVNVAAPEGYEPRGDILEKARVYAKETGVQIRVSRSPAEAVRNADVIYSDVWVSMGQENEEGKRLMDFNDFQVNCELTKLAKKDYIFMHCLPAHRGQEVTEEVIDGKHSIVFDQAENRLHVQKAILVSLIER